MTASAQVAAADLPGAPSTITVGTYDFKPLIFKDQEGNTNGIFADLLADFSRAHPEWQFLFETSTLQQCLNELAMGRIDLVPGIVRTGEREKRFSFSNEPVISTWGQVYCRKGESIIGMLNLEGKRIAGQRGDFYLERMKSLLADLGISSTLIEVDDSLSIFTRLAQGKADAGVVERLNGLEHEKHFQVERSPIIFEPRALVFATTQGRNTVLLNSLDQYIASLRASPGSTYHASLDHWIGKQPSLLLPSWAGWVAAAAGGTLILFIIISLLLEHQVQRKTREISVKTEQLRHERDRAQSYLDTVEAIIVALDTDGLILQINRKGCRLFGKNETDLLGSFWFSECLVQPEGMNEIFPIFRKLISGEIGMTEYVENRIVTGDGEIRDIAWHNSLICSADGTVTGVLSAGDDITKQKFAQAALEERERFLTRMIDQSPFAIWVSDPEGWLIHANPALKTMLNLTDEQLVGKYNVLSDPLVHKQGLRPLIQTVYEDGATINFICDWDGNDFATMDLKGSNPVSIEATMFPIHAPDGALTHVILNWIDITARKQAEKEIQALNRELEHRVKQRTIALENVNKELEDFVYSISHDLRAPLRAINGFSEIIANRYATSLNDEGRHYFDNIIKASVQMGILIDDLLKFSRLGRHAFNPGPVPLAQVCRNVMETLEKRITDTDAVVRLPEEMPSVLGDAKLLPHVFINLLDNALKYTTPGEPPDVRIRVDTEDGYVTVSVADNGIGIEPEFHHKIFRIFQRLHSQEDYPGTGIGLAAVEKAVTCMNGTVSVESSPGKGSVFRVRLPMALEHVTQRNAT